MTYLYDRAVYWPNVETIAKRRGTAQHATSLRQKRLKHFSTTRRVAPILTILLFFVSLLFGLSDARAQSPDRETAIGNRSFAEDSIPKIERESIFYFVERRDKSDRQKSILRLSPDADLERYPLFEYRAIAGHISALSMGEIVPDEIWDLPLRIVNDHLGRDSVTLRELAGDKLLVLDFWSTWCKPCLESMDKWETVQSAYQDELQVVGLMMDYDYKAEITIREKQWNAPQLIGPEVYLLNAYFCGMPIIGPSAWINKERFIGVTGTRADGGRLADLIISGAMPVIPEEELWSVGKTGKL